MRKLRIYNFNLRINFHFSKASNSNSSEHTTENIPTAIPAKIGETRTEATTPVVTIKFLLCRLVAGRVYFVCNYLKKQKME